MTNHLFDGLTQRANPAAAFAYLPEDQVYRYEAAFETSARLAQALVALGVGKGDRVAVQVPKSIEAVLLYLACVRAGAVFLPLNTAYTASELDYFLDNATPALFVCDPAKAADLAPLARSKKIKLETLGVLADDPEGGGSMVDIAKRSATTFDNVPCGPNDLAAILYTSGTTGRSKGAMLTHANLLSNAVTLVDHWRFTAADILLHALPIFHTHGLFVAMNVTLVAGASVLFEPGFQIDRMLEKLPQATAMMGVPTFYTRLLADDRFTKELVAHMRLFVSGSAPLLAETHGQFEERTGQRILERYGMTETNMNTSNPYEGERRAGSVGFPLAGIDVRICDPEGGAPLADGDIGVLEVSGPNVFAGYWQMPEKTAEDFRSDGYFITGDLARRDADGYIHIVGRSKDLIISGGYNIYPKEIELLLDEQQGVLESAVIGVPHPDFGEGVVAVVVATDPHFNPAETLEALRPHIARFKQPKRLEVVAELPRNTMGKVQKNQLRERFSGIFSAASRG